MTSCVVLKEIEVRPAEREERPRFSQLMQEHHYLGALRPIGETLWYVATYHAQWVALLCFSAAALKIAARDQWIGWSYRQQYARLPLLANNTRFCVLPMWRRPNLGSRVLALCERRISQDWSAAFGHSVLLLETFVDSCRRDAGLSPYRGRLQRHGTGTEEDLCAPAASRNPRAPVPGRLRAEHGR
jgi:hypothetical protein